MFIYHYLFTLVLKSPNGEWPIRYTYIHTYMGYVRILFLDVTAWSERLKLLDFILVVYSYFKSPRVDPRRPSGSIKGFEQGRGTGYPSLPLCLIEESLFGAAIHNLLRLIRSLQSGRHQFFHFSPAWGTYESYSLM